MKCVEKPLAKKETRPKAKMLEIIVERKEKRMCGGNAIDVWKEWWKILREEEMMTVISLR